MSDEIDPHRAMIAEGTPTSGPKQRVALPVISQDMADDGIHEAQRAAGEATEVAVVALPAAGPGAGKDDQEIAREEHRALGWAAVAAVAVIVWLVRPIGVGILLGTLLAFMAQPLFERMKRIFGASWAAAATVFASMIALAGFIGGLAWLFVAKGTVLSQDLIKAVGPGGFGDNLLAGIGQYTARIGISQAVLEERARDLAANAASSAATIAEAIASTTASALLGLFFTMLSMHFFLRNWQMISVRAQETFPLRPEYTAALFREFRNVGRTTLRGALGTGVAQGAFAVIGYWIAGVPEPVFFGALTAVASFVPAVGVLLVIVPTCLGLFLVGQPGHAIVELTWGLVVVVGICDYVIRPRLVRGESKVPSLVTFAALFGGVEVVGLKGLIVGPVVMALAIAVLRLYATEARKRRHLADETSDAPP